MTATDFILDTNLPGDYSTYVGMLDRMNDESNSFLGDDRVCRLRFDLPSPLSPNELLPFPFSSDNTERFCLNFTSQLADTLRDLFNHQHIPNRYPGSIAGYCREISLDSLHKRDDISTFNKFLEHLLWLGVNSYANISYLKSRYKAYEVHDYFASQQQASLSQSDTMEGV